MAVRAGTWLLALSAVLVAGCSSEEPPGSLPALPSASPIPSAAPTPAERAFPQSAQGASAFATHYLQEVGRSYQSADPSRVSSLSAPGCGGCAVFIDAVTALREAGQRRIGGDYRVSSAVTPALRDGDAVVDVIYSRPPGRVVDSTGAVVASGEAVAEIMAQLRVVWRDGTWLVQGYRTFSQ